MKYLFMTLLLVSLGAHAGKSDRSIYVFGDSLSYPSYSWAEIIDDSGYADVKNVSRGGLKLVDVTIPDWLDCGNLKDSRWAPDTVIIWLGSNDIFKGESLEAIEAALRDAVESSIAQGCETYVILPLPLALPKFVATRAMYQQAMADYPVHVVDMPYSTKFTLDDGIHQNKMLHLFQAFHAINVLGLEIDAETISD